MTTEPPQGGENFVNEIAFTLLHKAFDDEQGGIHFLAWPDVAVCYSDHTPPVNHAFSPWSGLCAEDHETGHTSKRPPHHK